MELRRYKLSQLITIKNGKDYKHLEEGEVPVFGSGGYMCSVSSYLYDKVSILLPRKGTLSNIQYFNNGKFWTVDTCFFSIINESLCDPYYLYRYLRSLDLSGYDTGASIPSMTQKTYNGIKVTLPTLPTQQRIASILSTYDNLIENNNRRIRLLEQMAENLYKEWFVRFRFPGHENAEFENGLPKGWKRDKIGKIYETCSGGTPSRDNADFYNNGSIPWVKTGELQDCLIHNTEESITEVAIKKSSAKILPNHSLLMAMYGVNIGKLGILCKEMACNQAVCAFLPNDVNQTFYYLYFYLKSIRSYLLSISFGAAQQNLSQALIKNVRIMIPSDDIILKFEKCVSNIFNRISILQQQNDLLSRQRDLLLPRLMSGKLEVNV